MNRNFLRWFYVAVQFVMLAVSIPKVAMLFHAYDVQTMGPLIGGVDLRSWLVGIAIDLTATFTSWAAMHEFAESRKRSTLIAPAFIILACTGLSVIANYEDAATLQPEQYTHVFLFTQPAQLINPILISAPPVLAQPRIKTPKEIIAEARTKEAQARANAKVRTAQVDGLADTVGALIGRAIAKPPSVQARPEAQQTKPRPKPPTLEQ